MGVSRDPRFNQLRIRDLISLFDPTFRTLPRLMQTMFTLNLDVIDHRSWHSRFEDTAINEIYAKGIMKDGKTVDEMIKEIESMVVAAIGQQVSSIEL